MSKKSRKNIKVLTPPSNEISTTSPNENKKIIFSFEYFDEKESDFSMKQIANPKEAIRLYESLLKAMKNYSQIDRKKIHDERTYSSSNHIHSIKWQDEKCKKTSFTNLNKKLMEQIKEDCWQLGITTKFRIHGFFIENVFYVVWLDPLHKLYPMAKYNTN